MDDPGSSIPLGSIILYLLFIVGSAYFSGTEISLATVNRIHMMSYADNGSKGAKRVLRILDHFDEALVVLLIGNNIMNIGCATLSVVIATNLWGGGSVTLATVATTVILFIFGEMAPKSIARACNESFVMFISGSLLFLMKVLKPISWVFTKLSDSVSKPLIKNTKPDVTMTEDEFQDIVENISVDDGFDVDTGKLVKSAFLFDDLTAAEVMTPWDDVQKIYAGMKTDEIIEQIKGTVHSRLPVIGRDGSVKGILQIRRFMRAYIKNKHIILASVMDYPYYIRPEVAIDDLLTQMSNHRRNLAIVKGSDGKPIGILTIEDILEQLVGEIYDEDDIGGGENG
ncbi:MAG: HlyC/CorC family transporter [Ruminococcaceae bacterium]|nr:HlyC/CorC family transporter [Oscillospiraceae bacterium]